MKAKQFILAHLRKFRVIRTRDIVRAISISRQTAHQHLQELIRAGKLVKEGSTLSSRYKLFSKGQKEKVSSFSGVRKIRGLEEDRVYDEAELRLKLKQRLSPEALKIVRYAFTEMMNNVISHSKAPQVEFRIALEAGEIRFEILDAGVGVFESVRKKFKLKDPFEAAEHLLKGKQTTDPEHHSGQGIFFTSKIADKFVLSSQKLSLTMDEGKQDTFLEELRKPFRGTWVEFSLKQRSRKELRRLFEKYSDEDYEFHKTRVVVHLSVKGGGLVSRSEAKRILFGLEKFKHIVLDFHRVKGLGQGFADEVFRVFRNGHPGVLIEPVHMIPPVAFMVKRAQADGNA
ncbi:MAG: DUF4325 domain-containing protein [Candidatus Omnitrophota bacterium]